MNSKYESIYRVLLAFMLVDWNVDESEKNMIQDFLHTKFWQNISKESQNVWNHKDMLNKKGFLTDLENISNNFSREELFEILDFIAKLIKSDEKVDKKEIELLKTVLEKWKIEESMINVLWLKKSFLSNIFG